MDKLELFHQSIAKPYMLLDRYGSRFSVAFLLNMNDNET